MADTTFTAVVTAEGRAALEEYVAAVPPEASVVVMLADSAAGRVASAGADTAAEAGVAIARQSLPSKLFLRRGRASKDDAASVLISLPLSVSRSSRLARK